MVSGEIVACEKVKLACQRHINDLQRTDIYFDENEANRFFTFSENLKHIKGKWDNPYFRMEPWQKFVCGSIFGWKQTSNDMRRFRTVYVQLARKNGKALDLNTKIPTPQGWKLLSDIHKGDIVFDENGNQTTVLQESEVFFNHQCYSVKFSTGEEIVADEGHLWKTIARRTGRAQGKRFSESDYIHTTENILKTLKVDSPSNIGQNKVEWNHRVAVSKPIKTKEIDLPIPPYVLGCWLGDGNSRDARLTCAYKDMELIEHIRAQGVSVEERKSTNENSGSFLLGSNGRGQKDSLQSKLRALNLLNNKHIPEIYLRASVEQRLELLQGLMDTDGTASKAGQCSFDGINKVLCDGVLELLLSLGFKSSIRIKDAKLYGRVISKCYSLQFFAYKDTPVFKLTRKFLRQKETPKALTRNAYRQIVAVDPVSTRPVKCIMVDSPSKTFLAGEGMIPTHNSTLAAWIGLYMMVADCEPGAEVYSAATTRDQARIIFNDAKSMVRGSKALSNRLGVHTLNIHDLKTSSKFEPVSSDADSLDGLNVHCALIDELHAHKDGKVWQVLDTATGSRRQPLMIAVTTAGFERSVCIEKYYYCEQVLTGVVSDDAQFAFITEPDDDDWKSETAWKKANPNYGVSVFPEQLERLCKQAQHIPSEQNNFLTKHLNKWTNQANRWIDLDVWNANGGEYDEQSLIGRECYGGLDLAATTDINAFVLLFPPTLEDDKWRTLYRFWVPEEAIHNRSQGNSLTKVAYDGWEREGWLHTMPGKTADYLYLEKEIVKLAGLYDIKDIAYDPWNATQTAINLEAQGLELTQYRQGAMSFNEPMKRLESLLIDKKFNHGNCPVMTWMANNMVVRYDANLNMAPDKGKAKDKIDGVVALLMALGLSIRDKMEQAHVPSIEVWG